MCRTSVIILFLLFKAFLFSSAQTANFNIAEENCLYESISLENNSVAFSYSWDFCHTDLASSPNVNVIETINATNSPEVIKLVYDSSNWYGFVASRLSDEVFRLDYGSSVDSVPSVSSLGDLGMTALRPNAIDVINDSGIWYAIVLNQGGVFFRLTFANGLSGEFTVEDLGDLGGWQFVHDVKIIQVNEDFIVSVADGNGDKITMINFGNSISNDPIDQIDIGLSEADITNTYGIDFVETGSGWHGFAADIGSDKVLRMDFGNDLMSEPEYTTMFAVTNPTKIRVVKEGLTYTGIVMSQTGGLYRMNFGVDVTDYIGFESLGKFSGVLGSHNSFDLVKSGATWRGLTIDYQSKELIRIDFEGDCATEMSMNASTAQEPTTLSYNISDEYLVELSAFDEYGNVNSLEDTIMILNSSAPQIQISVDESRCILNENYFDIITAADLQSYEWDFDGDGEVDFSGSTLETINYQFLSPGTYDTYLSVVSSAGCGNTVSIPLTIYDEPPAPSFTMPSSLCTNSTITFENETDISGFEGAIEFNWTIDSQIFEAQDFEYVFSDPGTYEIALTSKIPGCESMPFSASIDIIGGPDVNFDWSNNCFGEAVSFTNLTTETAGVSFVWDFGDGVVSSLENPSHQYASAGEYNVSLQVENGQGCSSVSTRIITVNDMGLAGFVQLDSIENLPIRIQGLDKTLAGDSVVSWIWDFGAFGVVNGNSVEINFHESPGDYSFQLSVQTAQGCEYTLDSLIKVYDAPYPTIAVSFQSVFCKGEDVAISNQTVNADKYYWDFCLDDLNTIDSVVSLTELDLASSLEDLKIVYDRGLYYGFASSRLTDELIRLTFNQTVDSVFTVEYLDVIGGQTMSRPGAVELIQEGGQWYGFISNSNNQLIRLNFDDGLSGSVSVNNFGNIGSWSFIQKLKLAETEEGKMLIVVDGNGAKISILNLENSVQNTPVLVNEISNSEIQNPYSIRLIFFEGSYIAFLVDLGTDQILKLNFEESLLNTPIISSIEGVQNPTDIAIEQIAGNYVGYITQQTQGLLKIELGIDLNGNSLSELGNYEGFFSNVNCFELIRTPYSWRAFALNFSTNQLVGINFKDDCEESEVELTQSSSFEPIGLKYYESGVKPFFLTAEDENGNRSYLLDSLMISADSVPVTIFTPDQNLCIANPTIWKSEITEGNVTTYSWDLDGDGLEDSSDPNPTFQYASPGVYDIRLDVVSDAGCTNYVEDEIELYPEPPVPVFEASASTYCTESVLTLTNITDHTAYDGLVEYHWSITGLSDTTTTGDLAIGFAESGVKIIAVYSAIPGCESVVAEQTVEIFDAPITDFSATTVCSGELTAFTNLSETADYIWDFGDGIMSSGASPEHFYASPGTYDVQLTSTDARGCVSMSSKQVMVSPLPQVSFDYPQVCKGEAALFEDQSFVEQSDVIAWEWFVDDVSVATTQDASIIFETSGTHNVRLVALSQAGCIQSYAEDIEVEDTPDLLIESDGVCLYEMVTFTDETADQSNVQQRIWMVDGAVQSSSDQTLTYTFSTSGVHEVQMIVDQVTGCSGTTKLEIDIPENPQLDFVWDQNCDNEDIIFTDMTSESAQQAIASRVWKVNGEPFGNGASALLPVLGGGTYEVSLESTTDLGCELALIQTVTLDDAPDIDFTLSNDYGVPPFSLSVSNQTQYASEYIWTLDGAVVSTNANPIITIDSEGVKTLKLVATGSSGCKDSSSATINSALPIIDLRINEMQLLENGNANNILVNLSNLSNIPVETLSFSIELEDEFVLPEQVYRRIESNEQAVITLNTSIPVDYGDLKYLCVSVYSTYDVDDLTPVNNETCQNLATQKPVFEPPFPNPAKDQTVVKAVLPESGEATISVIDMSGQIQVQKFLPEVPAGLNVFEVSLLGLDGGTYMIDISFKGGNYNYRVIKQ